MMGILVLLSIAGIALAGCAGMAKPNVRSALMDAGVRAPVADCMAQRMTYRRSISQLQKLKRMKGAPGEKMRVLSAAERVERAGRSGMRDR